MVSATLLSVLAVPIMPEGPARNYVASICLELAFIGLVIGLTAFWITFDPSLVQRFPAFLKRNPGRILIAALLMVFILPTTWIFFIGRDPGFTVDPFSAIRQSQGPLWIVYYPKVGRRRVIPQNIRVYLRIQNHTDRFIEISSVEYRFVFRKYSIDADPFPTTRAAQICAGSKPATLIAQPLTEDFIFNKDSSVPPHSTLRGWVLFALSPIMVRAETPLLTIMVRDDRDHVVTAAQTDYLWNEQAKALLETPIYYEGEPCS